MKNLSRHTEWLSLIEISGPFLTVSMLEKAFPQGLEAVATPKRQKLKAAYEEWREAVDEGDRLLPELHREWIRLVLTETLEYDDISLIQAADWPGELPIVTSQEHAGRCAPDWIVRSPSDEKPRMFVSVLPPDTDLESIQRGDGWPVSLQERMTLLCRAYEVPVSLLTDGERWMLVNAPIGSTSSQVSWYARLWFQEPVTLKAFQSLLGVRRCFGPTEETLAALLDESLKHHEEVTDTLGEQVRRAVEVLVQCLDKADEDRNRELLRDVKPAELYEAGLTVMMRLVFVLCAEERGLLLTGDSIYDQCYAVSTLRGHLAEDADRHGPEVLDRRHDAWARLLAVFRAVYSGIEHESLRMPALGGSLFDPDRFPFLEGRAKETHWRDTSAAPLPIDNRTVLLLLNSLQILEQPGGALLLSYRALDVEQIGHVYEGLLEHTVVRVPRVTVGLQGSQKAKNPNVALAEMESARLNSDATLMTLVLEITGRSESAIKNGLSKPVDETIFSRVLGVCGGDSTLAERIRPFANLLRSDAWEDPIVYRDNSFMVTLGADRRETGTHYTPKSLTESIVTTTLEPVVYVGPAEGNLREAWMLKSSREILELKVCDPAMGSGAFLVQACRYLGEKLVEAWLHEETAGKSIDVNGDALDDLRAGEPMSTQLDERLTIARRLVAERCLYGVDINPLAVELAKLSIWLVTLAIGRPFGFLDHNLRSGDSLLGIHSLEQLTRLSLNPKSGQYQFRIFGQNVEGAVKEAIELRMRLRATTIREVGDVEAMARLNREASLKLKPVELIADAMIGEAFCSGGYNLALDNALDSLATMSGDYLSGNEMMGEQISRQAKTSLSIDLPEGKPIRKPFHWPLEFPEVFHKGGFDSIFGNPPFLWALRISIRISVQYSHFLKWEWPHAKKNADLCSYFLLRSKHFLKTHGCMGFVVTNTISEADTKATTLDYLVGAGSTIFAAKTNVVWPGTANVRVANVFFFNGAWQGKFTLDEKEVLNISTVLEPYENLPSPERLNANKKQCFKGSVPLGAGFFLSTTEANDLINHASKYRDVIFPFINGQELNDSPELSPGRLVIYFRDWSLEKCRQYPEALNYLEKRVKPERDKIVPKNNMAKQRKELWWKFTGPTVDLYDSIRKLNRVLVASAVSKHHCLAFLPSNYVYSNALNVFAFEEYSYFSLLQSSIHSAWALSQGSKLEDRPRYNVSDCFETFPFPEMVSGLFSVGRTYYEAREKLMQKHSIGLTDIYNRFHNQSEDDHEVRNLREHHVAMDLAVVEAYGWENISLEHDFYESKQGIRFSISEQSRVKIIKKIVQLNSQRYQEEVQSGLYEKMSSPRSPKVARQSINSPASIALFDFKPSQSSEGNRPDQAILDYLSANNTWLAKDNIVSGSGISANQWQETINQLVIDGLIERQGERRGARYRAVKRS